MRRIEQAGDAPSERRLSCHRSDAAGNALLSTIMRHRRKNSCIINRAQSARKNRIVRGALLRKQEAPTQHPHEWIEPLQRRQDSPRSRRIPDHVA
jgi:hypothetical protein